jgi:hypothetical protein
MGPSSLRLLLQGLCPPGFLSHTLPVPPGLQNSQLCPCWAWTPLSFDRHELDHPGLATRGTDIKRLGRQGGKTTSGFAHHGETTGFFPQASSSSGLPPQSFASFIIVATLPLVHIVAMMTLDRIVATMASDLVATMALDTIVASDTIVAFVTLLVSLMTSSPVMWLKEHLWNYSVLQRVQLCNLCVYFFSFFCSCFCFVSSRYIPC